MTSEENTYRLVVEREKARDLVKEYMKRINHEPRLETVYLYSNFTCNENCSYCWIQSANIKDKYKLKLSFVENILQDLLCLGLKKVKISGGEPLLNEELPDIINCFLKAGINVEIESNGTLITDEFLKKISPYLLDNLYFKISLDSVQFGVQEKITEYENAFENAIKGIHLLKNRNIKFDIITVANKLNYSGMDELIDYVKRLNPVRHRIILNIQPIGHGLVNKNLNLEFSEIESLINNIYSSYSDYVDFGTLHSTLPPAFVPVEKLKLDFCAWGYGMCGIMPNGDVSICAPAFETMGIVAGNILETSIKSIWGQSDLFDELRSIPRLEGVCGQCVYREACRGMCRIFAKAKYGKITSPYPFCQEMYERGLFPAYCLE